ncbi:MAG: flagellar protein FlaG [Nitrospirota bacterium]|nr:flagellar protein FlaG [Nitrospirota bacterium]
MIPTISQQTSFITISVGQEVRVRDRQQVGNSEILRSTTEKDTERQEPTKVEEQPNSKLGPEQVENVVARIQEQLQHVEPRIELSIDKDLGQVIFRLFDKESGDLIRQIPSEQVLELDRFFADQSGLFVKEDI